MNTGWIVEYEDRSVAYYADEDAARREMADRGDRRDWTLPGAPRSPKPVHIYRGTLREVLKINAGGTA